jgi:hypothetical protein
MNSMKTLPKLFCKLVVMVGLFFASTAHAEIEFHCKELSDTSLTYCKFAILVQGDDKAELRFTIKQGEVKNIPDAYIGREYCYQRGFEYGEMLPEDKTCGALYFIRETIQKRNLDAHRELEISSDEQRLSCTSGLLVLLQDGCIFLSNDQSIFVEIGRSIVTKLFPSPTQFCVVPIKKNQFQLSFDECRRSSGSKQYLSGRFNRLEGTYDEETFEQMVQKEPVRPSYFTRYSQVWFQAVESCLTDKIAPDKPDLVFIQFFDNTKKFIGHYEGIPRNIEEIQIRKLCAGKWRLHSSLNLAASVPIADVQIKTNEELMKAIEDAKEQLFQLSNSLGLSVKLKIRNYSVYQEIYADVNGIVVSADELAIGLSASGKPLVQICNGQSFCSAHYENYVLISPNKDICVSVKAKKNGIFSGAFLEMQIASGCAASF